MILNTSPLTGGNATSSVVGGIGLFSNGSAASPSLSFASDTDTGLYRGAANELGVAVAGVRRLYISGTTDYISGDGTTGGFAMYAGGAGTVGSPAFTFVGDSDSGLYRIGANNVGVAVNAAKVLDVATTGLAITGNLSVTTGYALPANGTPTIQPAAGGMWQLATAGTDVACTNGTAYFVELNIPYNVTLTGLAYQVGSVGGTDSVIVTLYNSTGTVVANSALAGATVGTAAQIQSVAFTGTYAAVSGRYFASVCFNGTTAKFRAYPIPGSKFIAGSEAETFGTVTAITPGTTFTADKGPLCYAY